jgi:queuine tRNA-ribosyltransferase
MFELIKRDGRARLGRISTPHGQVETPAFMNVATQGAIKGGLDAFDLKEIGCQIALSNTYHLHLRPSDEVVASFGGLHRFMNWDKPILTDSGGFQIYSLASLRKITEEGVHFNSHINGARIFMGPEESMRIQANLGSDIAMAFDECVANPSTDDYVRASCDRTVRWLIRCRDELSRIKGEGRAVNPGQMLFGINQGGINLGFRQENMQSIAELDLPGYAIGGLAVGEETSVMYECIDAVEPLMPSDKPRYLMGVGKTANIIESVALGVDLFDCVLPARNARHGHLYTKEGCINLNNEKYIRADLPIDPGCGCPACERHSRGYIRHLLKSGELLGLRLCVQHNLYFFNHMMEDIRAAIREDRFAEFRREWSGTFDRRI